MFNVLRGLALAFTAFAGAFGLHIVGGAMDQRWLFAIAVALIFLSATGFPAFALLLAGDTRGPWRRVLIAAGLAGGFALTMAALWAANGRATAWWHVPLAVVMEAAVSAAVLGLARWPSPGATPFRASR